MHWDVHWAFTSPKSRKIAVSLVQNYESGYIVSRFVIAVHLTALIELDVWFNKFQYIMPISFEILGI